MYFKAQFLLCFCLFGAVFGVPRFQNRSQRKRPQLMTGQFCSATSQCPAGNTCCTMCPQDAACGPGAQYSPKCQRGTCGMYVGDPNYLEFNDRSTTEQSPWRANPQPSLTKQAGEFCSSTDQCGMGHTCCTMCPMDAACGPGTQFSPKCQQGQCGMGEGDPNFREFKNQPAEEQSPWTALPPTQLKPGDTCSSTRQCPSGFTCCAYCPPGVPCGVGAYAASCQYGNQCSWTRGDNRKEFH